MEDEIKNSDERSQRLRPRKAPKKEGNVEFSKGAWNKLISKFSGLELWVVGGAIVLMLVIFVAALMNNQNTRQGLGIQSKLFTNPNRASWPNAPQYLPQRGTVQAFAAANSLMGGATSSSSVPPIFRDAVMPHAFRGVCENCHVVNPDIPISATARMPHQYRGVCSNCHVILGASSGT